MTKKFYYLAGILLLLIILFPLRVGALTLSPPLFELAVDPGSETGSKIKVINETKDTVTLYVSTANFTSKDEAGNPYFLFDEKEGLADWIKVETGPIVLLPGERRDVLFTIEVPKDADPGGHYAGIFFSSGPPELTPGQAGQVGLVAKLGTLILLRVSGDVTIKSAIQEFHILNDQRFFTRLPVQFWYRLYNSGNLHVRPEGTIEIKNILGFTIAEAPANPSEGAVLPDSMRKFEPAWKTERGDAKPSKIEYKDFFQNFFAQAISEYRNFAFGRYTAALKLTNVPESLLVAKISFWVFPWHFLIVAIIALALALWIVIFIISRYNRWIIKKALRQAQDNALRQAQGKPGFEKENIARPNLATDAENQQVQDPGV